MGCGLSWVGVWPHPDHRRRRSLVGVTSRPGARASQSPLGGGRGNFPRRISCLGCLRGHAHPAVLGARPGLAHRRRGRNLATQPSSRSRHCTGLHSARDVIRRQRNRMVVRRRGLHVRLRTESSVPDNRWRAKLGRHCRSPSPATAICWPRAAGRSGSSVSRQEWPLPRDPMLEPYVLWTDDGGLTWLRSELPAPTWSPDFLRTYFAELGGCTIVGSQLISAQSGVVLLECLKAGDNDRALYRTADGGQTWEAFRVPSGANAARSLDFLDPSAGWLFGRVIYGTRDGGRSWLKVGEASWEGLLVYIHQSDARLGHRNGTCLGSVRVCCRSHNRRGTHLAGTHDVDGPLNGSLAAVVVIGLASPGLSSCLPGTCAGSGTRCTARARARKPLQRHAPVSSDQCAPEQSLAETAKPFFASQECCLPHNLAESGTVFGLGSVA